MSYEIKNVKIIGDHQKMQEVYGLIIHYSRTDAHILISGDTGTGKELVARAIHETSGRAGRGYDMINSASFPTLELFTDALFGHVKGAYTSAHKTRAGLLEAYAGETLGLDEILSLDEKSQLALLRVLQKDGDYTPLGSNKVMHVTTRIVALTQDPSRLRQDVHSNNE